MGVASVLSWRQYTHTGKEVSSMTEPLFVDPLFDTDADVEGEGLVIEFDPVTRDDVVDALVSADVDEDERDEYLDFLYGNDPEDVETLCWRCKRMTVRRESDLCYRCHMDRLRETDIGHAWRLRFDASKPARTLRTRIVEWLSVHRFIAPAFPCECCGWDVAPDGVTAIDRNACRADRMGDICSYCQWQH